MNGEERPAAFLDRDGVLNVDTGYPHRPDQIRWIEGAVSAVARLNRAGLRVFVITNQSGIARGLFDEGALCRLMDWMIGELARQGARIDDWRHSPYHPDYRPELFAERASWRKPAPGMLLDLMRCWPTDRDRSFVIGDKASDLAAGRAAGIAGHLFAGGNLDAFVAGLLREAGEVTRKAGPKGDAR